MQGFVVFGQSFDLNWLIPADALDLSRFTIQKFENGKNATIDTVLKIANHFDLLESFYQALKDLESSNDIKSVTEIPKTSTINNKRNTITIEDVMRIAEEFVIKNPKGIIKEIQGVSKKWKEATSDLQIQKKVIREIEKEFVELV